MTVYLDIFFLKNIIFNFMLIYLTSLLIRKRIKIYKVIIASCIGGIYAIFALHSQSIFDSILLKIMISIVMLVISFGKKEVCVILSSFFCVAFFVAGIIGAILNIDDQIIMIIFAVGMTGIFCFYKNKLKNKNYYEVEIELFENRFDAIAKLDTGNELKDSLLGEPVIVISEDKAKKEFDDELIKILNNERLEIPNRYKNKIKLISFNTISDDGIKMGIRLDKVIIEEENKKIESKATMILSKRDFKTYDVLIGKSLLEGGYEYENISFNKIKN